MAKYKNNISKLFTKTNFSICFGILFFVSATAFSQINDSKNKLKTKKNLSKKQNINTVFEDSTSISKDNIIKTNTNIKKDSVKKTNGLKTKLIHFAKDYTEINQTKKFIKLYNKAVVKYDDFELSAGVIYIDYEKKEIYAGRLKDSLGNLTQRPVFTQKETKTENDSIRFNYETKKALVWNTFTKEGDISLLSEITKKVNDSVLFVSNVKFTTSKDREHPEYYFLAKKGKIIPKKKIVVGTTQMWIEEVPTPLIIPFGFFPLISQRASGFLVPTFGESNKGFFLQNGGFYWAANPYTDLTVTADFYTNGSYALHIGSRYVKRYKFNGNIKFNFENNINGIIGLPNYSKNRNWHITWRHSKDSKSSPLSSFSASVNFGSSKYFRNSDNYYVVNNITNQIRNELSSSINYNHRFSRLPINYSISLNHSQNVNKETLHLTLPQINLNVSRIYPFSKNGNKKNALQKINMTYKLDAKNQIETTDKLLLTNRVWEGKKIGAKHSIPIQTNMKIFKYFNFNPHINYTEIWQLQYVDKYWDSTANNGTGKEITEEKTGFKSFRNIDLGATLSTNYFFTYIYGDNKKIQGIRHTLSPSLSYSYNPKFNKYIYHYEKTQDNFVDYTQFDNGIYGRPNLQERKTLILSLNQNLEAKYKTKDGKIKKLKFLRISNSYDFQRDSMRLSTFNLNSNFELIKGLNINMNSQFDPYAIKEAKTLKEFAVAKGQGLGRFKNFIFTTGYHFNNNTFKNKKTKTDKEEYLSYTNNITWDLSLYYDFRYKNSAYISKNSKQKSITGNSLNFSGKIQITPNWKIGFRSGYDFVRKGSLPTSINFTRELKSWIMRFDWRPFGQYKSWYFYIGIKSSILSDIKYDKRSEPIRGFF